MGRRYTPTSLPDGARSVALHRSMELLAWSWWNCAIRWHRTRRYKRPGLRIRASTRTLALASQPAVRSRTETRAGRQRCRDCSRRTGNRDRMRAGGPCGRTSVGSAALWWRRRRTARRWKRRAGPGATARAARPNPVANPRRYRSAGRWPPRRARIDARGTGCVVQGDASTDARRHIRKAAPPGRTPWRYSRPTANRQAGAGPSS